MSRRMHKMDRAAPSICQGDRALKRGLSALTGVIGDHDVPVHEFPLDSGAFVGLSP